MISTVPISQSSTWTNDSGNPFGEISAPPPAAADLPETPLPLGEVSDEALLALHRQGEGVDQRPFAMLVARYEKELGRFLSHRLGDSHAAEDMLQQVWLKVHVKAAQFETGKEFRPWLFTIAANAAIDLLRRQDPRAVSLDQPAADEDSGRPADLCASRDAEPIEGEISRESAELVRAAVDRLPTHLAEALKLVYWERLKYREAAEQCRSSDGGCGIPVSTVKSRLHHGLKELRRRLAGCDG